MHRSGSRFTGNMADRYFNRVEAEELLPLIVSQLEQVRDHKRTINQLNQELSGAGARIMMLGGSIPTHQDLTRKKIESLRLTNEVEQAVAEIQETGCVVKDLDEGLVDFPSLRDGREVYLCWKLGEERIAYWHGLEEGFAGRKPLDEPIREDETPPGRIH